MSQPGDKRILLWGDTQVGKTALLASAFFHNGCPFGVDEEKTASGRNSVLFQHWQRIRTNQMVHPTVDKIDFTIAMQSDRRVSILDIKGRMTGEMHRADVQETVASADGILFLIEWKAQNIGQQLAAIEGALSIAIKHPKALIFTKCELGLTSEDPAWKSNPNWWRGRSSKWAGHERVLERLGGAVWATSAYGYDVHTRRPALILGEFGQMMPYQVDPRNVKEPFEWILGKIMD